MSAQIFYNNGSSSSEIITHLVNASDGAGLHFDGTDGRIDIATVPDLGTKFSFEFIIQADSWGDSKYICDFGTGGRFSFASWGDTSYNLAVYDTDFRSFGVKVLDDLKVHHLVMTVDGTSAILYDNGNQVGTATLGGTPNVDSCTDAAIGSYISGTTGNFDGTIYRARFWNKTLSSTDVTSVYESASIDFADQWGSQTDLVSGWNFTSGWAAYGSGGITDADTFVTGGGGSGIQKSLLTVGKKYRVTIAGSSSAGTFQIQSYGEWEVLVTGFGTSEFTATTASIALTATASATIDITALTLVEIGCVSDYDLSYANPTQSTIVQNRSGSGDGTAAGGVTQISPIEAVNTNKLNVGGTTPLVGIGVPPGSIPTVPLEVYGNIRAQVSNAGGFYLTADTGVVRNNATGVAVRTAGADRLVVDTAGTVTTVSDCAASPGSGNVAPLILGGATDGNKRLLLGFNTTANQGFIQAVNHTVAYSDLVLQPAGGNVGLGESAPTNLLTLKPAIQSRQAIKFTVGTTTVSGGYIGDGGESENLWITAGGEVTATTASANGFTARNNEGGGAGKAAAIRVGDGAGTIKFYTASGLTNGNTFTLDGGSETGLALAISNAGLATFSAGIAFSGQTDASGTGITSGATTLNHYEEGTWSPTYISGSGSFGTMTMDVLGAMYTRVGNQVTVTASFRTDNVVLGTASSYLKISGLPFTSAASNYSAADIGWASGFALDAPISGYIYASDTNIGLVERSAVDGNCTDCLVDSLTTGASANKNTIQLSATYFV